MLSMPPEPPAPSPADQRLRRFLSERMRMSHIDQPLMLVPQASAQRLELLGHGLPSNSQPGPSGGHRPADPGRRRAPD